MKIYEQGAAEVALAANDKIAVFSNAPCKIYRKIGYPNVPATWTLWATTVAGTEYLSAAVTVATDVRVEAGADFAYYEVGTAPVISEPLADQSFADATGIIQGLAAAQGGSSTLKGGTSSMAGNAGGAAYLTGGEPGETGVGGAAAVAGGAGGATSGNGGVASVTGGAGTNGNAVGGIGKTVGGAGQGTGAGGKAQLTGGASGGGATGNGGDAEVAGGAATSTAGNGGAATFAGGVGTTTGVGGAATLAGGAGGNNASGGVASLTGGAAGGGNNAGAIGKVVGGAGAGTGNGGAAQVTGGASGTGATGDGGDASLTGGAASSTDGNGGSAIITGGAKAGGGIAGAVIQRSDTGYFRKQSAATAKGDGAQTVTAAQLIGGICVHTITGASTLTTPTGAQILAGCGPDIAAGDSFDFTLITLGAGADDISTLTAGDGDVTFVGDVTVGPGAAGTTSAGTFRFRYTGANAFVGYRIG